MKDYVFALDPDRTTATTGAGSRCCTATRREASPTCRRSSAALRRGIDGREFYLTIEGLDNRADVDDQRERLAPSLDLLRRLVHA